MAKKVVVQFVDDIDDKPITSGGEHITFAVDGVEYEIDLNDKNAREFHRKISYYTEYATKVNRRGRKSPERRTSAGQGNTKAIREWALANGYEVSARGRIPANIEEAYNTAH